MEEILSKHSGSCGIGEKRLRQIASENQGEDFALEIGAHIRFKRKLFEEYLDKVTGI